MKFSIPVSWEEKKRRIMRYVKLPWKIIFISVNPEKQNSKLDWVTGIQILDISSKRIYESRIIFENL